MSSTSQTPRRSLLLSGHVTLGKHPHFSEFTLAHLQRREEDVKLQELLGATICSTITQAELTYLPAPRNIDEGCKMDGYGSLP